MLDNEIIQQQKAHIALLEKTVLFLRHELYASKKAFEHHGLEGHAWVAGEGIKQSIEMGEDEHA